MKIKEGVDLTGCYVFEHLGNALFEVDQWLQENGHDELTITSGVEGKHSKNSRHYIGMALDFRTRNYGSELQKALVDLMRKKCNERGIGTIVILESNHIHLQINKI